MQLRWVFVTAAFAMFLASLPVAGTQSTGRARTAASHRLPPLDGASLKVTAVEVTYGPGESSQAHSHPCPVVGYVVEGAVRMQFGAAKEQVFRAGDTFYEGPNDTHAVSANASDTTRARLVAFFTCDRDVPLSGPPRPGEP